VFTESLQLVLQLSLYCQQTPPVWGKISSQLHVFRGPLFWFGLVFFGCPLPLSLVWTSWTWGLYKLFILKSAKTSLFKLMKIIKFAYDNSVLPQICSETEAQLWIFFFTLKLAIQMVVWPLKDYSSLCTDLSYFLCITQKRDVCITASLILFQYPAVFHGKCSTWLPDRRHC